MRSARDPGQISPTEATLLFDPAISNLAASGRSAGNLFVTLDVTRNALVFVRT